MAKSVDTIAKVRVRGIKAMNAIRAIDDEIKNDALPKSLEGIIISAQEVAIKTLDSCRFAKSTSQQLSPKEATNEIGIRIDTNNNKAYLFAPIHEENKNSMYFLEYGAGIHNTRGKSHTNGEPWKYPIKNGETDIHREVEPEEAHSLRTGTGFIKLGDQAVKYQNMYGHWWGVTNTSRPVKYMQAAREHILLDAEQTIIQNVNIAVQNHTRRKK